MAFTHFLVSDEPSEVLFFHFDVEDSFLKLETFIQTAESADRIVRALDATFFEGKLQYELIVLPPDDGSFLSKIGIWVGGGAGALIAFLNTDIGAGYVQGLTGQPPSFWAEKAGVKTYELGLRGVLYIEDSIVADDVVEEPSEPPEAIDTGLACRVTAQVAVAMTKSILEKPTYQLQRLGMTIGDLPDAMDGRADFYAACIADPDVSRVGFNPTSDFPIPRHSFPERAIKTVRREPDEDDDEWVVSTESIYVTSPNWDEEDQQSRQWKGKDQSRRDCYFVIEDKEFWGLVRRKALRVEVLDNLKVQWAYKLVEGRTKSRRVLRVLEFNGEQLADALGPDAIRAAIGKYSSMDAGGNQPSLFGEGG